MTSHSKNGFFRKVLVPIVQGCEQKSAIRAARALCSEKDVTFVGFISIPEDESLSTAAVRAREVRKTLKKLSAVKHIHHWTEVHAAHRPWDEMVKVVEKEEPELLVLEYPCQFDVLRTTPAEVLAQAPCDIAIVNSKFPEELNSILIPLRGGPYAELALRLALSMQSRHPMEITSMHVLPMDPNFDADRAFRGLEGVLKNLPEVISTSITTDNPVEAILTASAQCELVVMGASARSADEPAPIGRVAQQVMAESECGVVIVKTKREPMYGPDSEESGQTAISVLVDKWFAENTFHADEFRDLNYLLSLKQDRGLSISLAFPALNEEKTVGNVIQTIKRALMQDVPLLDEIVLIDSNSKDRTREIAESLDVPVYIHQDTLPNYGARPGKGEALWKSLYCTKGDIVIWLDTDIVNIHPRFAYGLIGPLLLRPDVKFIKGFYRRPLRVGDRMQAGGGGRVTELTARPLLNLFFPELSGVIQPLSGEYGGRREALEQLSFFSGYGVEIGLLIDMIEKFGLKAIAQVDLQERIHHNQPLEALSKMSFAIIQAVMRKLERRYGQSILENVNKTMKLIRYEKESFALDVVEIAERDRPPMFELPEYRERLQIPAQK